MRVTGHPRPSRRTGFTLVEILVVIAIIAVLVSLTMAAVMKATGAGTRAQTRSEIGEFEASLKAMGQDLGNPSYLPSRLVLKEDGRYDKRSADHVKTMAALTKMFGRHVIGTFPNPPTGNANVDNVIGGNATSVPVQIDWNGSGSIDTGREWILQGPHCLVFYTGGIPVNGVPSGFSKDPKNPAAPGGQRYGPYFTFKPKRLVFDSSANSNARFFPVYIDPYDKMPYLYFSNNGAGNDYNKLTTTTMLNGTTTATGPDCTTSVSTLTLNVQVMPYLTDASNFVNPKGFQIVSAGADLQFGLPWSGTPPTLQWTPAIGYGGRAPGADDIANFSKSPLAGAQN